MDLLSHTRFVISVRIKKIKVVVPRTTRLYFLVVRQSSKLSMITCHNLKKLLVSHDRSGVSAWCSQLMNNKLLRFDQTNMLKKGGKFVGKLQIEARKKGGKTILKIDKFRAPSLS